MTIFRGGRYSNNGARAAVFFLWIVMIFSQLGFHNFAVHEEASSRTTTDQSFTSPSRKAQFFDTASFHAPSSLAQFALNEDDPGILYGDDKRIVHTGPNPLHN